MIEVTNEQIERVNTVLSCVPKGAERALQAAIIRARNKVRTETTRQIAQVYAISQKNIRAESNINMRTEKADGGIVGSVSFAGYKIPLYRFNISQKIPARGGIVKASVLKSSSQTPFAHAFIAKFKSGHIGMFERDTRKRLPVTEFMGPSTAQMAKNSVVLEEVEKSATETFNKRVEQEITRLLNGYGGKS